MSDETEVLAATPSPAEATPSPAPTPTPDEQALEAFSKGVESASTEAPKPADKPVEAVGATGAEAVKDAPGATAAAEPTPEEKAAAKLKADDDAEIKKLGIKNETTAARFRELNAEARKVPELTKQIEKMQPLAAEAERFNAIIADTKAQPEQIGSMLKYLKAINSGDPKAMNEAADTILAEAKALYKFLGRELPAFDPVAEHDDLKQGIEAGGVTPEIARETARARAEQKAAEFRRQQQESTRRAAEENDRVLNTAVAGLNDIGARLKTSDAHFAHKLAAMQSAGTIEMIKENVPPSRWVDAFKTAYAKIPDPAPKPPVGGMPLRPTGADPGAQQRTPKDEYEAFSMGVERARAAGQ